ncbi:uncharacterized protein LOC118414193 isoform X2 [Branchiostoma floridae]|uniref:Uncharacterized protein LOC118414193 isoform X2 n=1 Tax=Branchiostoma floridae TaxID=7739 RepID=A0A9J7MP62_BRAFL|nr:uncharacterized protein LOC118414193 isoform X2 [Branchiostoma floridae]
MSNSKKDSPALRQQKYSNTIIRGRRHAPTPEAVPPSTLLDAPPLSPVPLPSPPKQPLPESRYRRPKHLVTNLNKRQPVPQGGFTAVNRYSKTPTHPDENSKVFEEYAERLTNIQQKQDCMGEGKPRPRRPPRRNKTPAPVSMMMDSLENENMSENELYKRKKETIKKVQDSMGVDKTNTRKARNAAKPPTSRKTVEEQQVFSLGHHEERSPTPAEYDDCKLMDEIVQEFRSYQKAKKKKMKCCAKMPPNNQASIGQDKMSVTSHEVYTPDWEEEGRTQSRFNKSGHQSRASNTPTMERGQDFEVYLYTPDWEEEGQVQSNTSSQCGHLSRVSNTATMERGKDNGVYTPDWEEDDGVQKFHKMSRQSGHLSRVDNTPTMDCVMHDLDVEEDGQGQSRYSTSPQSGQLSRQDSTPITDTTKDWMYHIRKVGLEEMMESGKSRDEDSLHRKTNIQGKTTNKRHQGRKERLVLPSLTADPGLTLQGSKLQTPGEFCTVGTKLHTPGVSLPSIGDGKGVMSAAAQTNVPDEDMGTTLPQLQFGTTRVGKSTSDTVTFKQPSDKSKVRSTKRRQKTDRNTLKDKKSQKRRRDSSGLSSPDL